MSVETVPMGINADLSINGRGDFFRLMECATTVSIKFYLAGKEVADANAVRSGYAEVFTSGGFDKVRIQNGGTAQTIQFAIREGSRIEYDVPPVGNVAITNTGGAFSHPAVSVTNAVGGVVLSAANPLRRLLILQNNSASGTVWARLDGGVPVAGVGVKLLPGDGLNLEAFAPTGAIRAIGDIANNPDLSITVA